MEKHNQVLMLIVCTFLLFSRPTFSKQNTLTSNQFMQYGDTLVSAAGMYEAGFFKFGDPQRQYFGIWYKNISPRTIVWVANRNTPVHNSTAMLKLTDQGSLVILDGSKVVIWNSNSSRFAAVKSVVVQLLDSGNLVVTYANSTQNFLWESFDYPGNTFLAGMKLRSNLVTGPYRYLTSWRSSEDPADGEFSYRIETHGFPQQVIAKGKTILYRGGSWNGYHFNGVSWQIVHRVLNYSFVLTDKEVIYQYATFNSSMITRFVLDQYGIPNRFIWSDQTQNWVAIATRALDQCEDYGFCSINSNCNINDFPVCECLEGFMPKFQTKWKSSDWSGGCLRRTKLNCHTGDGFLKYTSMKLPDTSTSWYDKSFSLEECKTVCLKNCTCTAYANSDIRDGGSGCLLWFNNIVDMRKHPDVGQDIYIRLASSELDHKKNKRNLKLVGTLAVVIAFIIALIVLVLVASAYRKNLGYIKMLLHWKHKKEKEDVDLATIFDFSTITSATNQFSNKNKIGEGGFGPVYKGILADGQEIAVKRLSKTSGQGTEEFKNEVKLMTTLQHRNLVKLLGCSIQQDEKLLIYEFMPNKSLDCFIFGTTMQSKLLDWTKRLEIIDGIARGLLYLHQDSTLRIIHRDLKTSNILLDIDMIPKISDFGLARSFMGDQAEANTNRVMGTYGYMPPEYAVHGFFSIKSDVFSFGVVVLEIISGRKNRGFSDPQHNLNLLGHAWRLWIEERPLEFIADILCDDDISAKIIRFIHVGLLCVQQKPENRPNMSSVVFMLKGENLLPKPSKPGFYAGRDTTNSIGSSSINEASISLVEAR